MDNSESVESLESNVNPPSESSRKISRRRFLKFGAAAVGAAATLAAAPEVFKLIKDNKESKDKVPTYDELMSSVKGVYSSIGQEIPEIILERLTSCDEKNLSPDDWDPVRTVTDSCGEVGAAVRDIYRDKQNESFREVLHKIEIYTNSKIDKFVAEGRYPDPANIDGLKNQFKEIYFTP